jgi:hypothetical protein
MKEAPENGKESSHSAHANGMNESKPKSLNKFVQHTHQQWTYRAL